MLHFRQLLRKVADYEDPESIGSKFRKKRLKLLLPIINCTFEEYGFVNIIDIGGTKAYWNIISPDFLKEKKISITLVNLSQENTNSSDSTFSYRKSNACNMSEFSNKSFHIAHSNSVIEHVGSWNKMVKFSHEIKRVAFRYFVQTPNYWFPVEPHCMVPFFHWLPKKIKIWLVMQYNIGNWAKENDIQMAVKKIESIHLLDKNKFSILFEEAAIKQERVAGFSKSLIAIKS